MHDGLYQMVSTLTDPLPVLSVPDDVGVMVNLTGAGLGTLARSGSGLYGHFDVIFMTNCGTAPAKTLATASVAVKGLHVSGRVADGRTYTETRQLRKAGWEGVPNHEILQHRQKL